MAAAAFAVLDTSVKLRMRQRHFLRGQRISGEYPLEFCLFCSASVSASCLAFLASSEATVSSAGPLSLDAAEVVKEPSCGAVVAGLSLGGTGGGLLLPAEAEVALRAEVKACP